MREDVVYKRRGGGFALGAGDADDPVLTVPQKQVGLARYPGFHRIAHPVQKGYPRRLHYHIEPVDAVKIVLAGNDFDALCFRAGDIVHVRDRYLAVKLFQQLQRRASLTAEAEDEHILSVKKVTEPVIKNVH